MNIRNRLKKLLFKTIDFVFILFVLSFSMILLLLCTGQDPFAWSTYDERTNKVWHFITELIYKSAGRVAYLLLILFILVMSPIYFLLLAIVKWGWFKRRYKNKITPARDCLSVINASKKEYCLILRPFGNDAYFSWQNVNSEYFFSTFLLNWSKGIVLEQMIERLVRKNCGVETVALVDPDLQYIPSSPTFIAAGNDEWQTVVFDLIKKAMLVFVIISPGQELRPSLVWEMTKLIQLGMLGRFVLIVPPQKLKKNTATIAEIKKKLFFLADNIEHLNNAAFLIYPQSDLQAFQVYNSYSSFPAAKRIKYREVLGLGDYEECLSNVIHEMIKSIRNYSFEEKYLHASREFSPEDNRVSPEYLMMLFRTRREEGRE